MYRLSQDKKGLRRELAQSISERGIVTGSIRGAEGEGVAALLEQIAGGIDNDTEAFRKGMQIAVNEFGGDYVAFQGRIDEKTLGIIRQRNAALAKQIEDGTLLRRAYETYKGTMVRAGEDVGFRKKILRSFSSKRLDSGIFGTKYFKGRGLRDEAVREMYRKVAPKVGLAALAVGAVGVGYYISKKHRQNDLYDETMQQQPIESRGSVRQENRQTFERIQPVSTRRDPLVTAGVVGNLDRNKIGHTGMGPNKYSHLYG